MEERVMTKVVAMPMPMAVSSLRETPMNGQRPRNFASTKLLTKMVLTRISAYSAMGSSAKGRIEFQRTGGFSQHRYSMVALQCGCETRKQFYYLFVPTSCVVFISLSCRAEHRRPVTE